MAGWRTRVRSMYRTKRISIQHFGIIAPSFAAWFAVMAGLLYGEPAFFFQIPFVLQCLILVVNRVVLRPIDPQISVDFLIFIQYQKDILFSFNVPLSSPLLLMSFFFAKSLLGVHKIFCYLFGCVQNFLMFISSRQHI